MDTSSNDTFPRYGIVFSCNFNSLFSICFVVCFDQPFHAIINLLVDLSLSLLLLHSVCLLQHRVVHVSSFVIVEAEFN